MGCTSTVPQSPEKAVLEKKANSGVPSQPFGQVPPNIKNSERGPSEDPDNEEVPSTGPARKATPPRLADKFCLPNPGEDDAIRCRKVEDQKENVSSLRRKDKDDPNALTKPRRVTWSASTLANSSAYWVRDKSGFKAHLAKVHLLEDLERKYDVGTQIGDGWKGQIRKCVSKADGVSQYALKSLHLAQLDLVEIADLKHRIELLRRLDHPNIIKILEIFSSDASVGMMMEFCEGGHVGQRRFRTEADLQHVLFQLCHAVAHLHHHHIIHRNIKLQNVMFATADDLSVRLIDFGLSKTVVEHTQRYSIEHGENTFDNRPSSSLKLVTTGFYDAPEVCMNGSSHSEKSDVWAIGVIAFMLMTGRHPFPTETAEEYATLVLKNSIEFDPTRWSRLQPAARELVAKMLEFDPEERVSARSALRMQWLTSYRKVEEERNLEMDHTLRVVKSILSFGSHSKLRRAGLTIVSKFVPDSNTARIRDLYLLLDSEYLGELTSEQMYSFLKQVLDRKTPQGASAYPGMESIQEFQDTIFQAIDQDRSGVIHYMEFLSSALESNGQVLSESVLARAFMHLDEDGKGYVTAEDLNPLFGEDYTEEMISSGYQRIDKEPSRMEEKIVIYSQDFVAMLTQD